LADEVLPSVGANCAAELVGIRAPSKLLRNEVQSRHLLGPHDVAQLRRRSSKRLRCEVVTLTQRLRIGLRSAASRCSEVGECGLQFVAKGPTDLHLVD